LSSTVGDDIAAQNRGINQGHVYPYTRFNHREAIEIDIARGVWVDPVLWTPLPDPKADARIEAKAKHRKALSDQVTADKAAGFDVTQDHVKVLCDEYGIDAVPILATETARIAAEKAAKEDAAAQAAITTEEAPAMPAEEAA
jgi:hypothetical protein